MKLSIYYEESDTQNSSTNVSQDSKLQSATQEFATQELLSLEEFITRLQEMIAPPSSNAEIKERKEFLKDQFEMAKLHFKKLRDTPKNERTKSLWRALWLVVKKWFAQVKAYIKSWNLSADEEITQIITEDIKMFEQQMKKLQKQNPELTETDERTTKPEKPLDSEELSTNKSKQTSGAEEAKRESETSGETEAAEKIVPPATVEHPPVHPKTMPNNAKSKQKPSLPPKPVMKDGKVVGYVNHEAEVQIPNPQKSCNQVNANASHIIGGAQSAPATTNPNILPEIANLRVDDYFSGRRIGQNTNITNWNLIKTKKLGELNEAELTLLKDLTMTPQGYESSEATNKDTIRDFIANFQQTGLQQG